jgi:hypothetical protein
MNQNLRKLARITSGYQTRKGVEGCPNGTHYLLQIRDFNKERTLVDSEGMMRISPPTVDPEAHLRHGDVLFLAKGQRNFAWEFCLMPEGPVIAASYFFVARPREGVSGAYLAWFLNQEPAHRYFARLATTGAHMPIIRREVLEDLEVPLPDLATSEKSSSLRILPGSSKDCSPSSLKRKKPWPACLLAASSEFSKESPTP